MCLTSGWLMLMTLEACMPVDWKYMSIDKRLWISLSIWYATFIYLSMLGEMISDSFVHQIGNTVLPSIHTDIGAYLMYIFFSHFAIIFVFRYDSEYMMVVKCRVLNAMLGRYYLIQVIPEYVHIVVVLFLIDLIQMYMFIEWIDNARVGPQQIGTCIVCWEDNPGPIIPRLCGCSSHLCFECHEQWNVRSKGCPMCRKPVDIYAPPHVSEILIYFDKMIPKFI